MKKYSSITRVNSHRTSRNKRWLKIFIVTGLAVGTLWLLPMIVGTIAAMLFSPVQAMQQWLATSQSAVPVYVRDRAQLVSELESLQQQLAVLEADKATTSALLAENEQLRALLNDAPETRLLAGVIGRPNQTPYDVLILDQGAADGVVVGAPVYVATSTIIGQVNHVFAHSAVVELISSPGFVTSVYVYGPNIYTNAYGQGGGVLRVGVPQGIPLEIGNPVVLPAIAQGIFGTINEIESEPTSPEQFGYVTTAVPMQSLRFVSVGRTPLVPVDFMTAKEQVESTVASLFTVPVPDDILVDLAATSSATTSSASATSTTEL